MFIVLSKKKKKAPVLYSTIQYGYAGMSKSNLKSFFSQPQEVKVETKLHPFKNGNTEAE